MFNYQEYIFDLEQENVKLKEMREQQFTQLRDSLYVKYQQDLGREVCKRVDE